MNTRCFFFSAAALGLLSATLGAQHAYLGGGYSQYGQGYGSGYGYSGCSTCNGGYGWGVPGCCDRPLSKNDHLWDNYCQEKWSPATCSSYSQQYWRPGPVCSQNYSAPAAEHAQEPIEASPISSGGMSVIRGSAQPAPLPTPALRRQPQTPPAEVKPPMPPMPPMPPKTNDLELRLLPTTRKAS